MSAVRYLEKFENVAGDLSYTFPLNMYEWIPRQQLRTSYGEVIGASYGHDFLGFQAAPKVNGRESIRFLLVATDVATIDTTLDTMRSTLYRIGKGKLFSLGADGTRRWAYGRLSSMPDIRYSSTTKLIVPVALEFDRLSDWYATTAQTGTVAVNANPKLFTITNPGNVTARNLVVRLRSNGATGFTNPSLVNLTNGQVLSSTRDAVDVNSEWKFDNGLMQVLYSANDGVDYSNDYDLVTLGSAQACLMELEPGDNDFEYDDGGTPDSSLEWSFYPVYE